MKTEDLSIETVVQDRQGGQHVGIPHSGVRITHKPTGLKAFCECERSQMRNRDICIAMLEYGLAEIGWVGP